MANIIPAIESPQIIMYNATFSVSPVFGADFFVSIVVSVVVSIVTSVLPSVTCSVDTSVLLSVVGSVVFSASVVGSLLSLRAGIVQINI